MDSGELAHTPLTTLLPTLAGQGATGLLTLREPLDGTVRLWLRDGAAVLGERQDSDGIPHPDLLHRLRTAGLVDPRAAAVAREAASPVEHLLHAGVLTPRRLAQHVTELLLDTMAAAAPWIAGTWDLDPAAHVPELAAHPVGGLLSRAAERAAELGGLPAHEVPVLTPFGAYVSLDLAPEAWGVLAVTDGTRSTAEVAAACGLTVTEAVHVVAALVAEGLLRTGPAPATPPVVVPAPRRTPVAAPAPVDDLRVITTPITVDEPDSTDDPDTAALLRELSGLTGAVIADTAEPAARPAPPAPPAETTKAPRRRLFGR